MAKRAGTRRVDRYEAPKYAETGRVFLESAQGLSDVADEGAPYGNAIALLAIHAAISFTDALSIAFGERKSSGEHTKAVDALRRVLGTRLPNDRAKTLGKILAEKHSASYQGTYYTLEDGRSLLVLAQTFCAWAGETLQARPGWQASVHPTSARLSKAISSGSANRVAPATGWRRRRGMVCWVQASTGPSWHVRSPSRSSGSRPRFHGTHK